MKLLLIAGSARRGALSVKLRDAARRAADAAGASTTVLVMAFQMLVVPQQQAVGRAHEAFAADGTLADPKAAATLAGVIAALQRAARA